MDETDSEIWSNIGSIYQDQGLLEQANDAYASALRAADKKNDPHARALALHNRGGLFLLRKDHDQALSCFEAAERIFKATGDKINEAAAALGIANIKRDVGEWQVAQMKIFNVCVQYQALNDQRGLATAMGCLAMLYQAQNRLFEARLQYEQALALFEACGDEINCIKTVGNLATLCEAEGDVDGALTFSHRAQEGYQAVEDKHGETSTLVNLVRLYQRLAVQQPENQDWQMKAKQYDALARKLIQTHNYAAELIRLDSPAADL